MKSARKYARLLGASVAALALGLTTACAGDSDAEGSGETFTILQYEDPNSAQAQGWQRALEIFKEKHPDVKVEFQTTSFDAMRQNATITLGADETPDVVEFNKGNADGGQLAAQGLIRPLTDVVEERGWDELITGPMARFARYNDSGLAGSGEWYGIPNVGEYVTFYYNKDLFEKVGVEVPTSISEFEDVMDKLLAAGHTPISSSASTSQGFNQMWLWYTLVSAYADSEAINNFMFLQGEVDFSSGAWKKGTEQFADWIEKGYVGENLGGLNFEQAMVNFLSQDAAMYLWNQGAFKRIKNDAKFEWGYFTMPGANHVMGSSGHLWGVPTNADQPELAYDWIDITLSPEVQNFIGQRGGLPVAGDVATIENERVRDYTARFQELVANDALSYYPDYPVPGFLNFIQKHMQALSNKNEPADEYLSALQEFYSQGREFAQQG